MLDEPSQGAKYDDNDMKTCVSALLTSLVITGHVRIPDEAPLLLEKINKLETDVKLLNEKISKLLRLFEDQLGLGASWAS